MDEVEDARIEDIKDYVRQIKLELAEGVHYGAKDEYTREQINTALKKLPRTKYLAGKEVVIAMVQFKEKRRNLKKVQAQMMMRANSPELRKKLTNAADRKAWAEESYEIERAEIELIQAEAAMRVEEMKYECFDDEFTAVKKAVSIIIENERDEDRMVRLGQDRPQ